MHPPENSGKNKAMTSEGRALVPATEGFSQNVCPKRSENTGVPGAPFFDHPKTHVLEIAQKGGWGLDELGCPDNPLNFTPTWCFLSCNHLIGQKSRKSLPDIHGWQGQFLMQRPPFCSAPLRHHLYSHRSCEGTLGADLLELWCTKMPNIPQSGSALPPKQETAEPPNFARVLWAKTTPQNDPKSTPKRPPKTPTMLPRQVFHTVGPAGPGRAGGVGKGAGTQQQHCF